MRTLIITATAFILFQSNTMKAQSSKVPRYLSEPFVADSASTMFFPVQYNESMLSDNKLAFWREYYANFIIYDFKSDSSRRLFKNDVYILGLREPTSFDRPARRPRNLTDKWVLLLVKDTDTNRSRRIDQDDATVLYACTLQGNQLRSLTAHHESVTSLDVKEEFGFALIRIQKDSNNDGSFKSGDDYFYYRKIDLETLEMGRAIEIKGR